jgi:hypothetical protein
VDVRRVVALALVLSTAGGCIGGFRLTRTMFDFNREVSNSVVVQELVFLAFLVIPVYPVSVAADVIVLNTVELFTGTNPLRESAVASLPDGTGIAVTGEADGVLLAVDGHRTRRLLRRGHRLELVEDGVPVGAVEQTQDGALVLTDAAGAERRIEPDAVARVLVAAGEGNEALVAEVERALTEVR